MFSTVLNGIAAQFKGKLGGQKFRCNRNDRFHQEIVLACPGQFIEWDIPHLGISKIHGLNTDVADGLTRDQGSADLIYGYAIKKDMHILYCVDGYTAPPSVGPGKRVCGIESPKGGIIKDSVYTRGPFLEKEFISLVCLLRRTKPCQLPQGPGPAPVHGGMNTPNIRLLAGKTQIIKIVHPGRMRWSVQRFNRYA